MRTLALSSIPIVLPLLLAWWLVVRGVRRPDRKKRGPGDNAHGRHDAS